MSLKETMQCPLCPDGQATLESEEREFAYKGSKVMSLFYSYRCATCNEAWTTTESDTVSLENIYKAYDELHS